eukprot:GFUD01041333.1.p1 GENE.GFUD01041333.1~~GFUD01041333.1.p1  ORF type:complete len:302 (-),score=86.81 GFUD01041333.1:90-995(-)
MADYIWEYVQLWGDETEFKVPEGWEIVEMDESNFGEYLPSIEHLLSMGMKKYMEEGSLKFIRRRPDELEQKMMSMKDGDGTFYIKSMFGTVLATTGDYGVQLEPMDETRPQTKPNQIWKWGQDKAVLRDGTGRWLHTKGEGAGSEMRGYDSNNYNAVTFMFVRVEEDKFLVFGTGNYGRQTVLTVQEGSESLTVTMEEPAPADSEMRQKQLWEIIPYDQHLKVVETSELETYQEKGWRLANYDEVVAGGSHHFDMKAVMSHTKWVQAALKDGSQGGPDDYHTKEYEPDAEFGHAVIIDIPQ